jgi:hypothetical protein
MITSDRSFLFMTMKGNYQNQNESTIQSKQQAAQQGAAHPAGWQS